MLSSDQKMIQKIRKEIQISNHNLQNTEMEKNNNYYSLYTITTNVH